jgi:hypothetical protein
MCRRKIDMGSSGICEGCGRDAWGSREPRPPRLEWSDCRGSEWSRRGGHSGTVLRCIRAVRYARIVQLCARCGKATIDGLFPRLQHAADAQRTSLIARSTQRAAAGCCPATPMPCQPMPLAEPDAEPTNCAGIPDILIGPRLDRCLVHASISAATLIPQIPCPPQSG